MRRWPVTALMAVALVGGLVLQAGDDDSPLEVSTAPSPAAEPFIPPESSSSSTSSMSGPVDLTITTEAAPPVTVTTRSTTVPRPTTTTAKPSLPGLLAVSAVDRPGVYLVDVAGSGLRRLAGAGTSPVWSPDGRSVAYRAGGAVHVVDAASGADRKVADGFANGHERPTWSPDSRLVAYPGPGSGGAERDIWVASADGSAAARPIRFAGDDSAVAWGPDGRIAAMNEQGLWTFAGDGSARAHPYSGSLSWGELEWSPDGSTLLALPDSTAVDLLVGAEGQKPRALGGGETSRSTATRGSFSPAGDQVVYEGSLNWKFGLIVAPAGGGPGRVVAEWAGGPAWSPRGDLIAGVDAPDTHQYRDLITFQPDGAGRRTVVQVPPTMALDTQPGWSPDGRRLAFAVAGYDGPTGPAPRPTYGKGSRCGQPAGTDGNGATATSTTAGYTVTVLANPCTGRPGGTVYIDAEVLRPRSYATVMRVDYGDGTNWEYPFYTPPSCADASAEPIAFSAPWHEYRSPGQFTVKLTVRLVSCDAGTTTELTATLPIYQE